jgi:hypothetical protein
VELNGDGLAFSDHDFLGAAVVKPKLFSASDQAVRIDFGFSRLCGRQARGIIDADGVRGRDMKPNFLVVAAAASLIAFGSNAAHASCSSLWRARNQVYKDAGYCFKTARAIRAFGNAGCSYDSVNDVPLSANQRAFVQDIIEQERRMGCSE